MSGATIKHEQTRTHRFLLMFPLSKSNTSESERRLAGISYGSSSQISLAFRIIWRANSAACSGEAPFSNMRFFTFVVCNTYERVAMRRIFATFLQILEDVSHVRRVSEWRRGGLLLGNFGYFHFLRCTRLCCCWCSCCGPLLRTVCCRCALTCSAQHLHFHFIDV